MILVSVSGGKDSTATLLCAIEQHGRENVMAAFADTGNEHPITYDYVDYLETTLSVPIKRLKADLSELWWRRRDYVRDVWPVKLVEKSGMSAQQADAVVRQALTVLDAGPTGIPFLDLCIIKARFPSRKAQFCTQFLKTEPLTEYALELCDQFGAVESWQGVRAEESPNRARLPSYEFLGGGFGIHRPILRWTVADVFEAHRAVGIKPNALYTQGEGRVGCFPCINENKAGIANKVQRFPEYLERAAEWERVVSQVSKHQNATFFPSPGDNETARERGNIAAVIEWSKTKRGGRQYDLLFAHDDVGGCSSSYGLCDSYSASPVVEVVA